MPRYFGTPLLFVCRLGVIICLAFLAVNALQATFPSVQRNAGTKPLSRAQPHSHGPYGSSWQSWWHPKRNTSLKKDVVERGWNLFYHLGGNGPWIEKVDGVVAGGIGPLEDCKVEQVHMVSANFDSRCSQTWRAGQDMVK